MSNLGIPYETISSHSPFFHILNRQTSMRSYLLPTLLRASKPNRTNLIKQHNAPIKRTMASQTAKMQKDAQNSTRSDQFAELGIENTDLKMAPGVELSGDQKVAVGCVLDVSLYLDMVWRIFKERGH